MHSPRRDHAVCVHDGLLYVAGGFNGTCAYVCVFVCVCVCVCLYVYVYVY
ncbi:MAG: Kelch repeat-containing protein, partial [bacterium]